MIDIEIRRNKKHLISEKMIKMYCQGNKHVTNKLNESMLCDTCDDLLKYSEFRTSKCPYISKTLYCVNCPTPCYKQEYREKMQSVMKYSGPRFLLKHPIYFIDHYLVDIKTRRRNK